jgi:hypothetical protein
MSQRVPYPRNINPLLEGPVETSGDCSVALDATSKRSTHQADVRQEAEMLPV